MAKKGVQKIQNKLNRESRIKGEENIIDIQTGGKERWKETKQGNE